MITAIIGVRRDSSSTFYVRRSAHMGSYPNVWSLPSIKYDPTEIPDMTNLDAVALQFQVMAAQRLGGVPVQVKSFLTSGTSDRNPMRVETTLHLYEIEFGNEPRLNDRYYTDSDWLTAEQFERLSVGQTCGLCTRLWSDYAWLKGYTDRPFIPHPHDEGEPL